MYRLNRFIFAALLICSVPAYPADKTPVPIKVSVDKTSLATGERITYSLAITGEFDNPQVNIPEFTDFTIIAHNQSQGYSYINGKGNINFNLFYELTPAKPGVFVIKGATLKTKNEEFKTDPVTITVTGKPLEEKSKITSYAEKGTNI
jgi:hypothetical protein